MMIKHKIASSCAFLIIYMLFGIAFVFFFIDGKNSLVDSIIMIIAIIMMISLEVNKLKNLRKENNND